jgi:hypothetical protein
VENPVVAATRAWLEKVVIGLNLCPFAREPFNARRIRFRESAARDEQTLLAHLAEELTRLRDADPKELETTLLIHPHVLGDFLAYNDFLDLADQALVELELDGVIQIASFHPAYRFEGTEPDDVTNGTNRSPYPMLHLLREDSVARAVESYPDADKIPERNMETMRKLGEKNS